MKKRNIFFLLLMAIFILSSLFFLKYSVAADQEGALKFKTDLRYDIYYQLSESRVDCVERVALEGTKNFGGVVFLLIRYSDLNESEGYISIPAIKAIIPSSAPKPRNDT